MSTGETQQGLGFRVEGLGRNSRQVRVGRTKHSK